MKHGIKRLANISALIAGGLLIGWMSYWAGFSKSMEIGLYINQRSWLVDAMEYESLAAKLDAGKAEEVHAHLKDLGAMLRQQAGMQASGGDYSISDLLLPTAALSLIRTYNADRAKPARPHRDDQKHSATHP